MVCLSRSYRFSLFKDSNFLSQILPGPVLNTWNQIYDKEEYGKRSLFLLLSGNTGKSFIDEIVSLLKN